MAGLSQAALKVSKTLGLFRLSEYLFRNRLTILCYHGFAYADEHAFRPSMFMRPETLSQRVELLARRNYNVIPLDEAVRRLADGTLPPYSVAITIDDGFRSVRELAAPIFHQKDLPATVYVTTYYVTKQSPVFRLLIQYLAWKFGEDKVVAELGQLLPEANTADLMQLIEFAETRRDESDRVVLARSLMETLGGDYDQLTDTGITCLMSGEQLAQLSEFGIDVQLHTHRHRLPEHADGVHREIQENRKILGEYTNHKLVHFCYPSGYHVEAHLAPLRELGIQSATTCIPGMNGRSADPLTLRRFLDADDFDQIQFEAELRGFKELIRSVRSIFRRS